MAPEFTRLCRHALSERPACRYAGLMGFELTDLGALDGGAYDDIIDVRAPSEFAEDHVPGAISLPVLSDAERAKVGTIYKQDSPFKARKIGAALVARNAADHLQGPLSGKDGGWRPLVYCWRGGQRSGAFATILSQVGWRADTLQGGYQTYRRLVAKTLHDDPFQHRVVLLDGNTGTAKTDVLGLLTDRDVQVLDLEGLARHRGSVLGGQGVQPSQKAFESALAACIRQLDKDRPVVVEAESSKIGQLNIPASLLAAMRGAPRISVLAPVEERARYLVRAYGDLIAETADLCDRLEQLVWLRGRDRVEAWKRMAEQGQHRDLAEELIVHHYDPAYRKARESRTGPATVIEAVSLDAPGIRTLADRVADTVRQS